MVIPTTSFRAGLTHFGAWRTTAAARRPVLSATTRTLCRRSITAICFSPTSASANCCDSAWSARARRTKCSHARIFSPIHPKIFVRSESHCRRMVHCSRCAERAACNSSTRRPGASYLWRSPRTRTLAAARFRPTASSSRVNRRNLIPRSFFGMLPRGARFADFRSTNRATPPFLRTEKAWRRRAATQ